MSNIVGGGTPDTKIDEYWNGDINWYSPAEIDSDIYKHSSQRKITELGLNSSSSQLLPIGTVLYTSRAGIGKTCILAVEGGTNQGFQSIVPIIDKLDSYFIFSQTEQLKKYGEKYGAGSTFMEISGKQMRKMQILLPTIMEQKSIGNLCKSLDTSIVLQQDQLDNYTKLKKALLQKLFPADGEKVPKVRFAAFHGDWEQRKLGETVDIYSGRDYKHLNEGNIPVYGTGGYMISVDKALSYNEDAIGIGRKGTINKPYILKAPFWTVDTLFYAIPIKNVSLFFLYDVFQNVNWKKHDESTGVPSLSKVTIAKVLTLLPDVKEQQKIGAFFQNLDHLITLQQKKLKELNNLKKSLLQKLFI